MTGVKTNRPKAAELEQHLRNDLTHGQIAEIYGAHKSTVSKWLQHYGLVIRGGYTKPSDIKCGDATVVAMVIADGEPERYALPGGGVVGRDEARWAAAAMSIMMGGRA